MSDSKKLRALKEIRIKNLQKNLLDIQLKGIEHRININSRNKAELAANSGTWVSEHIKTAILKYNYEIDKLPRLLVKDFKPEEIKEYEESLLDS